MDITLSFGGIAALFTAMAVLATVPSTSVLIVTTRAATQGFMRGVAIKIAGALYLVWLGQALWRRSHGMVSTGAEVAPASVFGSFFSGLALTLGDQKAVLFYLGFLPAFVNLGALTVPDTAIVMAAAAVAVGGVKLAYAAVAARSGRRINGHEALAMARLAGILVTVIGLFSLGTVLIDALA